MVLPWSSAAAEDEQPEEKEDGGFARVPYSKTDLNDTWVELGWHSM